MVQIMGSLTFHIVLIVVLCLPPMVLLQMLARRKAWAQSEHSGAFRLSVIAIVAALIYNICVATFAAPRFEVAAISDGMGMATLVALTVSWLSIWGAVALGLLVRRRKYRMLT